MSATFSINNQKKKNIEKQKKEDLVKTLRFIIVFVFMSAAIFVPTFVGAVEGAKKDAVTNYLYQKYNESYQIESKLSSKERKEMGDDVEFAYYIVLNEGNEPFVAGVKNNTYFDTLMEE